MVVTCRGALIVSAEPSLQHQRVNLAIRAGAAVTQHLTT